MARLAHAVEYHQRLLHGRGRAVPEVAERIDADGIPKLSATFATGAVAPVLVTDPDNWSFRFRVHRDFYP